MKIRPFTIEIAQSEIDDLKKRISTWREPDQLQAIGWAQGTEHEELRRLMQHWRTGFDWRKHEAAWNIHPHYQTDIGGETIHFIHARAAVATNRTVILTHGWPGSVFEFHRLIPLLTDPLSHGGRQEDAFNVVAPSIPGYGFSSRPTRPGLNLFTVADLWAELMSRLGYKRYLAQGGDLGASVSTCLAHAYPDSLAGVHLNFIPGSYSPPHDPDPDGDLSLEERAFLERKAGWADLHGAYAHIQATRPQTLAYGLTDSLVGLAAWMIEKFRDWSDCDGDLANAAFRATTCSPTSRSTGSPGPSLRRCGSIGKRAPVRLHSRPARRSTSRLQWLCFPRNCRCRQGVGSSASSRTSASGQRCRAVVISQPSSSPLCLHRI
ncbi:epoxide hydrolase [Mesorhizobium sp. M7A.F.Ca.ET.027.02.1.1]|uniref:epoxide hydrolase family protein n=1 Tax=Mesorhizobium sp. M7A.F.Ca.ET.027.02.1.1 TaxID=2496655 RepID=UPI001FE1DF0A|nr:epoxide hydrolase [Mesorhizobium sp. M7A.F.Ca.ET.027.02.1.1]